MDYSVYILGYPVKKPEEISSCFSMMTYGLTQAFKKLPNVHVLEADIIRDYNPLIKYGSSNLPDYILDKLPKVDVVIATNYCSFFNRPENGIAIRSKCKKFVSFLEVPARADYCFIHIPTFDVVPVERQVVMNPIYLPEFTKNVQKEPNSILLDHRCMYWVRDSKREWSEKIWQWVKNIPEYYKKYSLVDSDDKSNNVAAYGITPIYATNHVDYMQKTEKMENFVVTHRGSYNYSIVDMASRGMRIIAPPNFAPKRNSELFNIQNFTTETDFHKILGTPVNKNLCDSQICNCDSIDRIVAKMNLHFQQWLV